MIYITGDIHGELKRFKESKIKRLKKEDILIICGDFGFVWDESDKEHKILEQLSKNKFTIAFVDGVHDRLDLLEEYPTTQWCGGDVHEISPNVFHLISGQVFHIQDRHILAIGGGYESSDTHRDILSGIPSRTEVVNICGRLESLEYALDGIVSHQAPTNIDSCITHKTCDVTLLTALMDAIQQKINFGGWYFGSYHKNKQVTELYQALYDQVICIGGAKKKAFGGTVMIDKTDVNE